MIKMNNQIEWLGSHLRQDSSPPYTTPHALAIFNEIKGESLCALISTQHVSDQFTLSGSSLLPIGKGKLRDRIVVVKRTQETFQELWVSCRDFQRNRSQSFSVPCCWRSNHYYHIKRLLHHAYNQSDSGSPWRMDGR
jgi:hypothetical protein